MKQEFFTVIPQNMQEYQMSIREADIENDLFRLAFEKHTSHDTLSDDEMMVALDYFAWGWEAAVLKLKDDNEIS